MRWQYPQGRPAGGERSWKLAEFTPWLQESRRGVRDQWKCPLALFSRKRHLESPGLLSGGNAATDADLVRALSGRVWMASPALPSLPASRLMCKVSFAT